MRYILSGGRIAFEASSKGHIGYTATKAVFYALKRMKMFKKLFLVASHAPIGAITEMHPYWFSVQKRDI